MNVDGLVSIAAQIQDRALLLASERGLQDVAEMERDQCQAMLERETKQNTILRISLLKELRSRHGYELEYLRIQGQQEEAIKMRAAMAQETEALEHQANDWNESWKQSVHDLYAPHKIKLETYAKSLEHRIRQRKRKIKVDLARMDFYDRRTREMLEEETELVQKMELSKQEIRQMDGLEEEEDEQVSSLAMQIKATLTKVSCQAMVHALALKRLWALEMFLYYLL